MPRGIYPRKPFTPEHTARLGDAARRSWADPEIREKRINADKARFATQATLYRALKQVLRRRPAGYDPKIATDRHWVVVTTEDGADIYMGPY